MEIYWCMTRSIPDTDSRLGCFGFLSIYLSNSAGSNRCITALSAKNGTSAEEGAASSRSHQRPDFTRLSEQAQTGLPEAVKVQNLGLHPGGGDNWPAVCFKSRLLMI